MLIGRVDLEFSATVRNELEGAAMRLEFLGKDSVPDQSPTLYATDNNSMVVQGWIVNDPSIVATIAVSEGEALVEVPAALMVHLAKAGIVGEIVNLVPPIVHVTEKGNYIIRGEAVTDREVLEQMVIPDHETCVEISRSAVVARVGD